MSGAWEQSADRLLLSLSTTELREIFTQARPDSLRNMLGSVGNDYDDIVRKTLENEDNFKNEDKIFSCVFRALR